MSPTLHFFALQTTLLAIVLLLHTYIGLHVIRRTLIFSDLVLDQLAAFGGLIGLVLFIPYGSVSSYLLSLGAVMFGAFLLATITPRTKAIPREAVIGTMYALALVACLLLGDKLPRGSEAITTTLTGSMLWVSWRIVGLTAAVYVVLIIFHYVFRHHFIGLARGEQTIRHVKLWDFLFFATQGVITVLIVPVAGILLAYSFLMIPAALAVLFTDKWVRAVWIGWSLGMLACVIGLCLSYFHDLPYGPTLVLALGGVFVLSVIGRVMFPEMK